MTKVLIWKISIKAAEAVADMVVAVDLGEWTPTTYFRCSWAPKEEAWAEWVVWEEAKGEGADEQAACQADSTWEEEAILALVSRASRSGLVEVI